jgi:hypothetical protein
MERTLARESNEFRRTHATVKRWLLLLREARYRLGLALLEVQDRKLWKEGGFRSFHAYLDSLRGPTRRTLQNYMALAYSVDESIAKHTDAERIEYALVLLPKEKDGSQVITLRRIRALKLEVERDGERRTVKFDDATTDELRDAAQAVEKPKEPLPRDVLQLLEATSTRLGTGAGSLGDARLRRRGKRLVLNVEIPIERVQEFLRRLR